VRHARERAASNTADEHPPGEREARQPGDLLRPADRLADVEASRIRRIFERAHEIEAAGDPVIHFEIGRPDFDTPAHIKAATHAALDAGHVHYSSNAGIPELRRAIADKFVRDGGANYSPDDEIIVTVGAGEAVSLAMMALLNPGDEVIIPTPAWPHYAETARLAGARPVCLPLDRSTGYRLHPEAVRAALTDRSRMLVVCSPNNPTGTLVSTETLKELADVLAGTDVVVLADEIYEYLVYEEARHVCAAGIPNLRDRTVVVGGLAKAYAMDGWRLGWLAGPRELVRWALRVRQYTTVCAPTFLQYGAVAALAGDQRPREEMRAEFARRRAAALEVLQAQDVLHVSGAEGAFYLYVTYDPQLPPATQLALDLLETCHVALVPGVAFGPGQDHAFRIAYSCPIDDVVEGIGRVVHHLAGRDAVAGRQGEGTPA
jgi:aspartate/methionine/tyrosine aminotransferase